MFDAAGFAAGLVGLGRSLAGLDAGELTGDELMAAAVSLERFESLVSVTRAHVLAELDARGCCVVDHGLKTASWVARKANTSPGAVQAQIRIGRALREHFDHVDASVAAGEISMEHARVILGAANRRNTDGLRARQAEMIADAATTTFPYWRDTIRRLAGYLDADGPAPALEDNSLALIEGIDGMGHLHGTFSPEQWLTLKTAVKARADTLFHQFTNMHAVTEEIAIPSRGTLLALALEQLVREGLAVDPDRTEQPRTDTTIVIRAGDPTHHEPDVAVDADGIRLPHSILPLYLCDTAFTALLVDHLDMPLKLGRTKRLANRAQRRAAAARDGGCTFPGCTTPIAWCDLHHANPHRAGGLTDIDNLPLLCRAHHGIAHRNGWAVHRATDGWYYFQTPTGTTFWAQRHFRTRGDPPPPPPPPPTPQPHAHAAAVRVHGKPGPIATRGRVVA